MSNDIKTQWPDLSKDQKAVELAKEAMGWNNLTVEEQMDHSRALAIKAQQIKLALGGKQ